MRAVLKKNPADLDARVQLGDFLISIKAYEGARKEFQEIQRRAQDNPAGYIGVSRLLCDQDKWEDAIKELEKGLSILPASNEILGALVNLYLQHRKYSAAHQVCEDRIKSNDQDALARHLLGRLYLAQKKYTKAQEAFLAASRLRPDWPEPREQLAELQTRQSSKE
jgi:tetratricopeptide (TPR) repeat protein